jgi:NAD(P)-dependent dehydrogenase (short-subunit alcohol dehydrogenase family)
VNNAGISRFATLDSLTRTDWERTIAVNLTGTASLCHWAAAHWRKQGPEAGRRLVNTTSGVGLTPLPGNPMYVAAKAGIAGLTIACAIELAELGVRANAIAPVARSRISEVVAGPMVAAPAEGFDRMSPQHIATLVTYLASPSCRFTGRVIGVVGDDITLFDGWTVSHHFSNDERFWSLEALEARLAEWPLQQDGTGQGLKGITPNVTPADFLLDTLAQIEK